MKKAGTVFLCFVFFGLNLFAQEPRSLDPKKSLIALTSENVITLSVPFDSAGSSLLEKLKSLVGRESTQPGPNCWNSVLVSHAMVETLRFTDPEELNFWLSSPYCKILKEQTLPAQGDILALRSRSDGELHAMLWIDSENVFSKNTSHRLDPYNFQRSELIFSMFRVTESACQAPGSSQNSTCQRWTDFFRCHSPAEDRSRLVREQPAYGQITQQWRKISKDIEVFLFQKNPIPHDVLMQIPTFRKEVELVEIELDSLSHSNPQLNFFIRALQFEIHSTKSQLRISENWAQRS